MPVLTVSGHLIGHLRSLLETHLGLANVPASEYVISRADLEHPPRDS